MSRGLRALQANLNATFGYRRRTPAELAQAKALAREKGLNSAALRKARALAAPLGVEVEKEDTGAYWVTCPALSDTGNDPLEGNHFCSDGREALAAVEAYAEHFKA
jgi:hypothetical protein